MEEYFTKLIGETLPELDPEKSSVLVQHLVERTGITSLERLCLVREDDLLDHLRPAEARLIILALKPPQPQQNLEGQHPTRQPLRDVTADRGNSAANREWNFNLNWNDIKAADKKIVERLKDGRKLSSSLRKKFVARVVNQVRDKVPAATRKIFIQIMKDIKCKYPLSFSHELAHGKVGDKSITKKMMDKYDNDKRPPRRTRLEENAPYLKAAYGCVKWRSSMPVDQTTESQEEIRERLAAYFHTTRPSCFDWTMIETDMMHTYASQRLDINRQAEALERLRKAAMRKKRLSKRVETENDEEEDNPPELLTATLADRWPFLFQAKGMRIHFSELTGKNFATSIETFTGSTHMDQLLEFLKDNLNNDKAAKKIRKKLRRQLKIEQNEENKRSFKLICLIRLLIIFFKEEESEMLLYVEPTTSEGDVATVCKLPQTPVLIIAGLDIFEPVKIFFSADSSLLGIATTLLEGLELMFCAYYVLNMVYAAKLQITLEFIQRIILEINPAKGHKRPPKEVGGRFSSLREHAQLTRMSTKYEEFLADKQQSSAESLQDQEI